MTLNYTISCIFVGITLISLLTAIGAIAFKRLRFKYILLKPVCIGIYIFMGYLLSMENTLSVTLLCCALVGIFDGTIGWYLSTGLDANAGLTKEQHHPIMVQQRIAAIVVFASVFGFIGYLITM